jgi:hypothetical protein
MSYTLFNSTTAATGLIAQPGRAVNTFPSGLVRVDQTYLGLTANATAHRATLAVGNDMPDGDTSPCIDALKIFPEVQERRREDGFTEYIVSAYGRQKNQATLETRFVSGQVDGINIVRKTVSGIIVSAEFPDFSSIGIPPGSFDPLVAFMGYESEMLQSSSIVGPTGGSAYGNIYHISFTYPGGGVTGSSYYLLKPGLENAADGVPGAIPLPLNFSKRNFGYWSEWIFSYG